MDYAAIHHKRQKRKDVDMKIPYFSHLSGVAYILGSYEFPEDVVVAGVLHDFLEDVVQKRRKWHLESELKERFGIEVHRLVESVTQQKKDGRGKDIDWHTRGKIYLERVSSPDTPVGAKAISCADKIHNIESLIMALDRHKGKEHKMWRKLKATPEEQVENFRQLHERVGANWEHPILEEFEKKINDLELRLHPTTRN
jgi:(p)ppGpp synthase/HD superfamily hydrolase